jgi:hypothetical protein
MASYLIKIVEPSCLFAWFIRDFSASSNVMEGLSRTLLCCLILWVDRVTFLIRQIEGCVPYVSVRLYA